MVRFGWVQLDEQDEGTAREERHNPRRDRLAETTRGPAVRAVGGLLEVGHTRVLPDPHNPLLVGGGVLRHLPD